MFMSATIPDGALAVTNDDGVQMNGPILGNAGAIFLAGFCAALG